MKKDSKNTEAEFLRQKAEELLNMKPSKTSEKLSQVETLKLVHELEVHQIELEMQNEELMRAKEKAEVAAEKYGELYDFAPAGYFTLSTEGEILQINHIGAVMLGKERSQLLNARFGFFVSDDTKPAFNTFLEKIFHSNGKNYCDMTLVRDNNEQLTVQLIGIANKISKECFISAVDITERVKAENVLHKSEENFRSMFRDHSAVMLLIEPSTGMILDANISAIKFYGYDKSVLCSMNISALDCLPEDLVRTELKNAIEQRNTDFIIIHKLANGNVRIVEVHSSPIEFQGKYILFSIIHDITDRIRTEVLLKNERLRLQGIIEGTNVGTWEWNIKTGEVIFNQKWFEMIGYMPEELSPVSIHTWETLTHPDDLKKSTELLEQHFKGERLYYECECRMKHKDGSWVWILDRGRVITISADGKPLMMFGTHTDITHRKYDEAERERLVTELKSALAEVKTLKGIVPICSGCKKIRDDKGFWEQVETYVQKHTDAKFSHGFCPDCIEIYFPGHAERILKKSKE